MDKRIEKAVERFVREWTEAMRLKQIYRLAGDPEDWDRHNQAKHAALDAKAEIEAEIDAMADAMAKEAY
jgi:hypothetical protein